MNLSNDDIESLKQLKNSNSNQYTINNCLIIYYCKGSYSFPRYKIYVNGYFKYKTILLSEVIDYLQSKV